MGLLIWTLTFPCISQGDRGFDGLPGLPGEKGHRVSEGFYSSEMHGAVGLCCRSAQTLWRLWGGSLRRCRYGEYSQGESKQVWWVFPRWNSSSGLNRHFRRLVFECIDDSPTPLPTDLMCGLYLVWRRHWNSPHQSPPTFSSCKLKETI